MTSSPTVSVVIATYNYGRYLAGAIDSVLAQTFQDFEIIVVDDGSTDETSRVMESYRGDRRIQYLQNPHLGQPRTKNAGIRAGKGRYVAFLDADDLWLPTKLEKQVELIEKDQAGRVAVVYTRRRWIDDSGQEFQRGEQTPLRGEVLAQVFHRPFICFSTSMVRRSVLDEVGLFDEGTQYSIDYDLWLRIALKYQFDFVDEPLVLYRSGHANMSSRLHERVWCVQKIVHRFLDECGGRERLDPAFVRMVLAENCCDVAWAAGKGRPGFRIAWYLKALGLRPHHGAAWRGLAVDWWWHPLRSRLKRSLGAFARQPKAQSLTASAVRTTL